MEALNFSPLPSYFRLQGRWLLLTPVTYWSKLPGIRYLAAFL
jgi:hypothetical protein